MSESMYQATKFAYVRTYHRLIVVLVRFSVEVNIVIYYTTAIY